MQPESEENGQKVDVGNTRFVLDKLFNFHFGIKSHLKRIGAHKIHQPLSHKTMSGFRHIQGNLSSYFILKCVITCNEISRF